MQETVSAVTFADEESEFLAQSKLGRIATSYSGQPHVVPVAYEFDGKHFYFGGFNLEKSTKFRDISKNSKVAFVVDDLLTKNPWRPRGIEIRGTAEIEENDDGLYVKITPTHKASWGLAKN
jgi:pyridoxamine 5'-phosphate oxidase family protein